MIFSSSVAYSKAYSNDNIRLKLLFGSYIPRRRLESVITSTGFTPVWGLTATHSLLLKTLDSSALEPSRRTTHTMKIITQITAIPCFQTEMATKRQNLRTSALNMIQIYLSVYLSINTILPKVLGHPLLMKCLTTLVISMSTNLNV